MNYYYHHSVGPITKTIIELLIMRLKKLEFTTRDTLSLGNLNPKAANTLITPALATGN